MKLLIDFSPIKSGGGAQLALNFLKFLSKSNEFKGAEILISNMFPGLDDILASFDCIVAPSAYHKRMYFEEFTLRKIIKDKSITHTYTFFGPGLPSYKGVRQVVSVAYPIICNDDSPYWLHLNKKDYYFKKLLNFGRKSRLARADHLIFETEVMRKRCIDIMRLNRHKTSVIPPTPTAFLTNNQAERNDITTFLLLSGLDFHKNIWRLIDVVKLSKERGIFFKIVLSATEDNFYNKYEPFITPNMRGVINEYFDFVGPISSDKIQSVYDMVDVILNIADLESFSNNYMEAWISGKPILASDRDFSRAICGESAVYVEPHSSDSIINGIDLFVSGNVDIKSLVETGHQNLQKLPTLDERTAKLKSILLS